MSVLGWALPFVPAVAGGVLAVCGRRADRFAPGVALLVACVTLGLAIAAAVTRPVVRAPMFEGLPVGMAVDGPSAVMVVTVAGAALAVLVFAAGEPAVGEARARFFGLMLVFVGAMLVTVTATDLALLLMAWEVMGAMSYALIGFWWHEPERVRSANIAFLTTRAGDMGLYVAAGAALAGSGTLTLARLTEGRDPWVDLVAAGVVAAALGKSAQLPFSFWLSRAMAGPSPVSALLHSATMVAAGAYLLLRLEPLLAATGWAAPLVAWVGAATASLLGAVALAQTDLKQLLAASTCAQIGFMVMAAGVGAVAGGTAHLVAHAAVKSLLFLGAGAWLTALGTKDLSELHGAARRHRLVGITFAVGALALAGVPPLSLWITKDTVLTAAAEESTALYVVGLAAAVVAAAYAVKALAAVVRPADAATAFDTEQTGTRRVGPLENAPLPLLAVVAAGFGLVGIPAVWDAWNRLVGGPAEHAPAPVALAVSGGAALAAAYAAARLGPRVPRPSVSADWLHLERAVDLILTRPVLALADALARFDDKVVDGAVRSTATAGRRLAAVVDRGVEVPVDGIVRGIGRGVGHVGDLARRPQTGQVHTYYAQAAVLLMVLAVILLLVR
ncbi:NADH-quinone oxidoreductase subunit L [Thermomonospora umbrina]|uniref:NADH:ubiquinone oxidoreductase subunit 5 (Subunit L)/multisubunit Na+/H+ antiporter MnhA subunit n=1 Tax=Thermomonospora umbrina TaxID=111806 RepID=A0A3D9SVC0_9ACTN|nr:proton-conducting transporter membrane subunit [Thermomonospora umbrina]REE99876.1 NADH:ubiquinone oxidoreductase subunit 5 (subunit L)/multisubunit Na+/H+ antiporter MnhA subunit [Thermomonospora umbrina]